MSSADTCGPRDATAPGEASLDRRAIRLLAQLPEKLRPMQLGARFPHILNRIARYWHAPELLKAYFTSLIVDERGDREGFPAAILEELLRLARYHDSAVFAPKDDPTAGRAVWNTVYVKR